LYSGLGSVADCMLDLACGYSVLARGLLCTAATTWPASI